jgi:AraC family transcriptional regulator, transcriptional activator of pobA
MLPVPSSVPRFFLYGEADKDVEARFIHVESIAARSRLHEWAIRPHRHSHLFQFLLMTSGSGTVQVDAATHVVKAPMAIAIPRGFVHGFEFSTDTDGWVISVAEDYAAEVVMTAELLDPSILRLSRATLAAHGLADRCGEIEREFRWSAMGRVAAITANLQLLFLALARLRHEHERDAATTSDDVALFGRFRSLLENWYREHRSLAKYTRALGVTEKRLAAACRAAVDRTPLELIHDRLIIEAKRSLLYTSMNIAEVGYSLGFEDPAYFSRFFTRQAGVSPRVFVANCGSDQERPDP